MKKNNIKSSEISLLSSLMNKDYYKDDNKEIFQKELRKIKPFKNIPIEEEIELTLLEKLVYKYELKYAIMINYITPIYTPDMVKMYSVTIKETITNRYLPTIYGTTLYEVFCKVALYYYLECNVEEKIDLKDWSKKYE